MVAHKQMDVLLRHDILQAVHGTLAPVNDVTENVKRILIGKAYDRQQLQELFIAAMYVGNAISHEGPTFAV